MKSIKLWIYIFLSFSFYYVSSNEINSYQIHPENQKFHCPICNMNSYDLKYNNLWYVKLKGGQRIYTCGMTSGKNANIENIKETYSHPVQIVIHMNEWITQNNRCKAVCMECNHTNNIIRDPINNKKITNVQSPFICFYHGQKIYFESLKTKNLFLKDIKDRKQESMVEECICNGIPCPDKEEISNKNEIETYSDNISSKDGSNDDDFQIEKIIAEINQFKNCPVCNMNVNDFGYDMKWYIEVENGQRIYTCGMTSGKDAQINDTKTISHPVLIAADMMKWIVSGEICNSTCLECSSPSPPSDPLSGESITANNPTFICFKNGQKMYFSSNTSKQNYLKKLEFNKAYKVKSLICDTKECPDSTIALTNSVSSNDKVEAFCVGATAMLSGFQLSEGASCIRLLFQSWVLNTKLKYAIAFIGIFLSSFANEGLVKFREFIRISLLTYQKKNIKLNNKRKNIKWIKRILFKLLLAFLYMIQMSLAYFLMLIVMTYEIGLFIALILGFGAGFLCFKDFSDDKLIHNNKKNSIPSSSGIISSTYPSWLTKNQLKSNQNNDKHIVVLEISGMMCMKNCGTTVQNILQKINGVQDVFIDFPSKKAYVLLNNSQLNKEKLTESVEAIGFGAKHIEECENMI